VSQPRLVTPIIALLLVLAPAVAGALERSVGISTWMAETPGARFSPALALDGPNFSLVGSGVATGSDAFRTARLASSLLLAPQARRSLELRLESVDRDVPGDPMRGGLRAEARLHFASPGGGAWMALATEQDYGIARERVGGGGAFIGFGTWARSHGAVVTLDLEQRAALLARPGTRNAPPDSGGGRVVVADGLSPGSNDELIRLTLTTTRAAVRWEGSYLALESVGGVTLSLAHAPQRWAQVTALVKVTPDLSAFAALGSRDAEQYLVAPAESPRASLGFQISHWRAADVQPLVVRAQATGWNVRRVDERAYEITLRAPGARLVEVSGDFTDWKPVTLEHAGRDRWVAVVSMDSGVHHANLRVDGGAWIPPPGAPTTVDGYNGTVGLVVVE
jgi:hypothetical protein